MLITAVALLFLLTARVNAQNSDQYAPKKVEVGFRLMPAFAFYEMQTSTGSMVKGQNVTGFAGGTFMSYNFIKHIGLQIEINYSAYSRKYKETGIARTINLQYIEIPILVSFNSDKIRKININAVLGPQMGINTGSNIKTSGNEGTVVPQPVLKVKQGGLSIAYGAGIDIGLNHKRTVRLGLGYRGAIGLFNISNNSPALDPGSYYIMDRTPLHTYSAYIGLSVLL